MADYHKIGLLVLDEGRILLCREAGAMARLILPGGSLEAGESSLECLERELHEELGDVSVSGLEWLGTYTSPAAGDASKTVLIELYQGQLEGTPEPHSEIAELVWFGEDDDRTLLAPSLIHKVLPDLLRRGILTWHA